MRSYDSPGDVVTIRLNEGDRAFYNAADMLFQLGELVGITEGPADPETGLINIAVSGVYNLSVDNPEAEGVIAAGTEVYRISNDTLGQPTDGAQALFGILLDDVDPGVHTARVRLKG